MKTNKKHTKKTLNPGFVLLVASIFLLMNATILFFSNLRLRGSLEASNREIKQLTEELRLANKREQEAAQALAVTESDPLVVTEETLESVKVIQESETQEEPFTTLTATVTAYCSCPKCCGIWSEDHPSRQGTDYQQLTASGTAPVSGRTVAVDPTVIPLGSKLVLNGHEYIAEDTGSAVKGNHIDVYFDSHEAALEWGAQILEVKVYEK